MSATFAKAGSWDTLEPKLSPFMWVEMFVIFINTGRQIIILL